MRQVDNPPADKTMATVYSVETWGSGHRLGEVERVRYQSPRTHATGWRWVWRCSRSHTGDVPLLKRAHATRALLDHNATRPMTDPPPVTEEGRYDPLEGGMFGVEFNELAEFLRGEGYVATYNDIDEAAAVETRCPRCGGPRTYTGLRRERSYRAFAVCVPCGWTEEF